MEDGRAIVVCRNLSEAEETMTCIWPEEHDPDCARCAVMRVCLAQVPNIDDERMARGQWAWSHQYACGRWKEGTERNRRQLAENVADRLVAWVRSDIVCGHTGEGYDVFNNDCLGCGMSRLTIMDGKKGRKSHPLDSTPVGVLRPCSRPCSKCKGTGRGRYYDTGSSYGHAVCKKTETDWPAVAKIVAYLDLTGPLLNFALAYDPGEGWQGTVPTELRRFTATVDDLAAAADIARALGHPVDTAPNLEDAWLARQGEGWRWVHEFREQDKRVHPRLVALQDAFARGAIEIPRQQALVLADIAGITRTTQHVPATAETVKRPDISD